MSASSTPSTPQALPELGLGTSTPGDSTAVGRYLWGALAAQGDAVEIYTGQLLGAEAFQKPVLIKRLRPHLAASRVQVRAFVDHARLAAQLNHAHIVQVLDVGRREGAPFIVFEAVDGPRLSDLNGRLARTKVKLLPAPLSVLIAGQILKALDYAHRRSDGQGRIGFIHRMIRPTSVLISRDGQVKVGDFGLPLGEGALDDPELAPFLAPEIRQGGVPGPAADLYSVAVILYQGLTGALPVGRRVPPPSSLSSQVPEALDRVVMRALSPAPEDRFEDADTFLHHLTMATARHFPQASSRDLALWVERLWRGPSAQASASDLDALAISPPAEAARRQRVAHPRAGGEGAWSLGAPQETPEPTWAGGDNEKGQGGGREGRSLMLAVMGLVLTVGAVAAYVLAQQA